MKPGDYFSVGNLKGGIDAALAAVKSNPQDAGARNLLVQYLCFAGEYERADKQLDMLGTLDTALTVTCSMVRQIIRAEMARQELFKGKRIPDDFIFDKENEELRLRLEALVASQNGDGAGAQELLDKANALTKPLKGTCNGVPFEGFRDLDDISSSFLEVLGTNGKYYWFAYDRIESLSLEPRRQPIDLLWRRARMIVNDGPDGDVYVPCLYAASSTSTDDKVRLGRLTDWVGNEGEPIRGVGLRMLLVGDQDRPIHEMEMLRFDQPEPPAAE